MHPPQSPFSSSNHIKSRCHVNCPQLICNFCSLPQDTHHLPFRSPRLANPLFYAPICICIIELFLLCCLNINVGNKLYNTDSVTRQLRRSQSIRSSRHQSGIRFANRIPPANDSVCGVRVGDTSAQMTAAIDSRMRRKRNRINGNRQHKCYYCCCCCCALLAYVVPLTNQIA